MKNHLGSRKRFLYRVVIYSLTPIVGAVVLISQWGNFQGMLLGGMGIAVGLFSQYQIYSRLQNPMGALKFSMRPKHSTTMLANDVLEAMDQPMTVSDFSARFLHEININYPDVACEPKSISEQLYRVIVIGEDLNFIISPSKNEMSLETASEILDELEEPLKRNYYHFIWLKERAITSARAFD